MKHCGLIFCFFLYTSILFAQDNIYGVYKWRPIHPKVGHAMIYIGEDGDVIYKMSHKDPIYGKWTVSNDTLIITSSYFIIEFNYVEETYDEFYPKVSLQTPYNKYGKLLSPADSNTDIFIIKDNGKTLYDINDTTGHNGYLEKTDLSKFDFDKYILPPINPQIIDIYIDN